MEGAACAELWTARAGLFSVLICKASTHSAVVLGMSEAGLAHEAAGVKC